MPDIILECVKPSWLTLLEDTGTSQRTMLMMMLNLTIRRYQSGVVVAWKMLQSVRSHVTIYFRSDELMGTSMENLWVCIALLRCCTATQSCRALSLGALHCTARADVVGVPVLRWSALKKTPNTAKLIATMWNLCFYMLILRVHRLSLWRFALCWRRPDAQNAAVRRSALACGRADPKIYMEQGCGLWSKYPKLTTSSNTVTPKFSYLVCACFMWLCWSALRCRHGNHTILL